MTATDADDPTYGNSAKLVYTLVQGQQYFSVDPQTGESSASPSDSHSSEEAKTRRLEDCSSLGLGSGSCSGFLPVKNMFSGVLTRGSRSGFLPVKNRFSSVLTWGSCSRFLPVKSGFSFLC